MPTVSFFKIQARIWTIAAGALVLANCAPPRMSQADYDAAEVVQKYKEGMMSVERYKTEQGCQDHFFVIADAARIFFQRQADESGPYGSYRTLMSNNAIDITFGLADVALDKKCFETARDLYAGVIKRYVGANYAGYRDRAKLGLDDINRINK